MTNTCPQSVLVALLTTMLLLPMSAGCYGDAPGTSGPLSRPASHPQSQVDTALMPANHTVDWMRRHGAVALAQGDDCAVCHAENDCVDCHIESLDQAYAVHPPNYEVIHASDANQGLMDCTTCHRLDTFCEACHIEAGVSPTYTDGRPSTFTYHPPGWLDSAAPGNHGVMARRDINDCASCHVERDCVSCHVGINPHPPEFRFDCARILAADPTPCVHCHIEHPADLQQLCF